MNPRPLAKLSFALLAAALVRPAAAAQDEVTIRRTSVAEPCRAGKTEPDAELLALSQKVDSLIYEAVQDQGLRVDISGGAPSSPAADGAAVAHDAWLVEPRIERARGRFLLKLAITPPGSRVSYQASDEIEPEDLDMRVVVMMRDLLRASRGAGAPVAEKRPAAVVVEPSAQPAHSPGRAVLALNATLLGGFVGYSLQHASGSTDERLTYPMVALGAGVGLGGSMLVSEEWDVGTGDAWFLSAGMWWPLLSGSLIASSYDVPESDRYAYGLLGTMAGVTLATTALSFGHMSDGGAVLTHSGGAFGTLLGGLVEATITGKTDETPHRGMGYGAGIGVLAAGTLATQIQISSSRVLMIDLGASLGALTGAAAASPLLLVDETASNDETRNRLWLASIAAGTLVGGAVGWWTTRPSANTHPHATSILPTVGLLPSMGAEPVFGAGVHGVW